MTQFNLSAIREKLENSKGRDYWRSLEEVAGTEEFRRFLEDEFPSRAEGWGDGKTRREMLRLMGAMFAVAGLSGCTKQPVERILPYVREPERLVPGRPLFFATAMPFYGTAMGLLVESHEGRPTKVEGNPEHPESMGRTMPFQQAATLCLYDPDRSQAVTNRGHISSWGRFLGAMAELRQAPGGGAGLHVLSHTLLSPALDAQRRELSTGFPGMRWHEYEPVTPEGLPPKAICMFEAADVILSLDADFLYARPGAIPYARAFVSRRHALADRVKMNRLYVAEPTPSTTGDVADHRLPMKALDIQKLAQAIAGQVGAAGAASPVGLPDEANRWAAAVAKDLQAHKGTSLVVAGDQQPASVHELARAMNQALGNVGTTVNYIQRLATGTGGLGELNEAMKAGTVRTLICLGTNPVYDAPGDLQFEQNLHKVPLRIHLGLYQDETARLAHWHIPETHFLESWSDAMAYDGTVSIVQPLIAPLYDTRSAHEVLATLTDNPDRSSYQIVRQFWQAQRPGANFEEFWERALHDGVVAGGLTGAAAPAASYAETRPAASPQTVAGELEIVFRPDPCVWDGRFTNNGWLQELPKPHTKLTWDNAAYVSPSTAERLEIRNGDLVELQYRGRQLSAPIWIVPGQAPDSVAVFLGYGRRYAGRTGSGLGYNAYQLRTLSNPHADGGLRIRKLGQRRALACTQDHHSYAGRDIIRQTTNAAFLKDPSILANEEKERHQVELSIYPEWKYDEGYRWGMAIDMNACIGCNACVIACQTENNIPIVGKQEVDNGREMHWIRVDRYHSGSLDNPQVFYQPLPCMQCEKAPCEPVCPVAATVHSAEGLNQMIYNRCIGTRYCSNNCPYKVRRFNFYLYADWDSAAMAALRNPDVTVRSRGVMEKCTYCVQRIQSARIETEKLGRRIQDGEVITACQGVCPTDAIIFGDMNDRNSRVSRIKQSTLNYSLLAELATQPRTTYLGKLRNPNPELETAS